MCSQVQGQGGGFRSERRVCSWQAGETACKATCLLHCPPGWSPYIVGNKQQNQEIIKQYQHQQTDATDQKHKAGTTKHTQRFKSRCSANFQRIVSFRNALSCWVQKIDSIHFRGKPNRPFVSYLFLWMLSQERQAGPRRLSPYTSTSWMILKLREHIARFLIDLHFIYVCSIAQM